jgi:hypothetical protein
MSPDMQRKLYENLSNSLFLLVRAAPANDQPVFTPQERSILERMYEIHEEIYQLPQTYPSNRRFFSSSDDE